LRAGKPWHSLREMPRIAALLLTLGTLAALGAPDPAGAGHGAPCLTCLADGVTQTRVVDGKLWFIEIGGQWRPAPDGLYTRLDGVQIHVDGGRIIRMGPGLAPGPVPPRAAR
jgi:hypothetical protein